MNGEVTERHVLVAPKAGRFFTPVVTMLAALHIVGYVVPVLLLSPAGAMRFIEIFGLSPSGTFGSLCLWQLLTHSMVYPSQCSVWSLIWIVLFFIFLGSRIEANWGSRRLLVFFLIVTVVTGLIRMLPLLLGRPGIVIGNIGVIYALLAAFGVSFRGEKVWVLFAVIPAECFAIGMIVIVLLVTLTPWNLLWLSGVPLGYLYVRMMVKRDLRPVRPAPAGPGRFSQIDLDD